MILRKHIDWHIDVSKAKKGYNLWVSSIFYFLCDQVQVEGMSAGTRINFIWRYA